LNDILNLTDYFQDIVNLQTRIFMI